MALMATGAALMSSRRSVVLLSVARAAVLGELAAVGRVAGLASVVPLHQLPVLHLVTTLALRVGWLQVVRQAGVAVGASAVSGECSYGCELRRMAGFALVTTVGSALEVVWLVTAFAFQPLAVGERPYRDFGVATGAAHQLTAVSGVDTMAVAAAVRAAGARVFIAQL